MVETLEDLEVIVYIVGGVLGGVSAVLLCALIGAYYWLSKLNQTIKNNALRPNGTIDKPLPRITNGSKPGGYGNGSFDRGFSGSNQRNPIQRRDDFNDDYYNRGQGRPAPPPPAMPSNNYGGNFGGRNPVTRNPLNDPQMRGPGGDFNRNMY